MGLLETLAGPCSLGAFSSPQPTFSPHLPCQPLHFTTPRAGAPAAKLALLSSLRAGRLRSGRRRWLHRPSSALVLASWVAIAMSPVLLGRLLIALGLLGGVAQGRTIAEISPTVGPGC